MIKLDKLNEMFISRGKSRNSMRLEAGIGGQSYTNVAKMLNGKMSNTRLSLGTIDKLCRFFDCQPGDIMEYVPDEEGLFGCQSTSFPEGIEIGE